MREGGRERGREGGREGGGGGDGEGKGGREGGRNKHLALAFAFALALARAPLASTSFVSAFFIRPSFSTLPLRSRLPPSPGPVMPANCTDYGHGGRTMLASRAHARAHTRARAQAQVLAHARAYMRACVQASLVQPQQRKGAVAQQLGCQLPQPPATLEDAAAKIKEAELRHGYKKSKMQMRGCTSLCRSQSARASL